MSDLAHQQFVSVITLNDKTGELYQYLMHGTEEALLTKRLKRLPAGHKVFLPKPRVWRVTQQALETMQECYTLQEIPPLKLHPYDGLPRFPYDHEEGKIVFSISTLGLGTPDTEGPWHVRKPVGHMYWTVEVSDLVNHPERASRPEIDEEHLRRMVAAATALRERLQQEYFRHRTLPQTEMHALEVSQKALKSTCEHFLKHGLNVQPVTPSALLPPAAVVSMNAVLNRGKTEVHVLFEDGSFARLVKPLETHPAQVTTHHFTPLGEIRTAGNKVLAPLDVQRIHHLLGHLPQDDAS